MTLSRRERILAIVIGVALLALIGGNFLLLPYLSQRSWLNDQIQQARQRDRHDADLLTNEAHVATLWKQLTATNLQSDVSVATNNMNVALYGLAGRAGFEIKDLKPDHAVQKGDFQQVRFQVAGSGSTESLGRFLVALEKTSLPMKINEMRVSSLKEGTDNLTLQMVVTTVGFSPAPAGHSGQKAAPKGDEL